MFSQNATLPLYLSVSLFVNLQFVSYYFSALNIFEGFSWNFARTLGRAVDKLLNGLRVNSHRLVVKYTTQRNITKRNVRNIRNIIQSQFVKCTIHVIFQNDDL